MPKIRILEHYCKGCGLCVPACPKDILYLTDSIDSRGIHVVKAHEEIPCIGCGNCAAMCPDAALEVECDE
jgi:2-oxoglutarate ferredoxin oxidoreductase subunit delta